VISGEEERWTDRGEGEGRKREKRKEIKCDRWREKEE
jgi:hypothetical protein